MISSVSARGLFVAALLTGMAAQAVTVEVPVNWTGMGPDNHWTTSANWELNTAPANDGTAQVRFGLTDKSYVLVDANQNVKGLTFDFTGAVGYGSYTLAGTAPRTLTIGASGLTVISGSTPMLQSVSSASATSSAYTYGSVLLDSSLGVVLSADQTWSASYNSSLIAGGNISGPGKLTLAGDGTIYLEGNNTYAGGTTVGAVELGVGSDTALGSGAVTFADHSTLFGFNGDRTLANAFSLNGSVLDLYNYEGIIKLTGAITLGAHTTLRPYGGNLFLDGSIGEATAGRMLTVDGDSAVVLSGANTYTGGTTVYSGALIFRNANSVPATGLLVSQASGYIGTGFATGVQSGFINKFDKTGTYSTIGFDTDPLAASATTFAEPIDLTGFNSSARLGSTTRAILAGNITPANGAGYQFGGGGGTLTVRSKLTGANALNVESGYYAPLTLRIENPNADTSQPWNDYTGTTTVANSAIIFGPGALSSGSANGSFYLDWGGYIGSQDATASDFIAKFNPALDTGVIGFDSVDRNAPRTVSGVNLSQFTAFGSSIALGTATAARISGAITLPAGQPDYIFTGYKGGWLTVDSALTGGGVVRIGDYYGDYPDFDPSDMTRMSTVFLNGSNTHTGGTELHSGRLVLGNTGALGTGALWVSHSHSGDGLPRLETSLTTSPVFTNAVVVDDDFEIGGVNAFTLAGNFRHDEGGIGSLTKHGAFNLTLSGDNSAFEGSFHIVAGTLTFAGGKAAGGGESWLTFGGTSGTAVFNADARSAAPVIAGLESYSTGSRVELGAGTTLTVDQSYDTSYAGTLQGSGALVKNGGATLRLESASPSFTGATTINAGSIGYAKTGALGTGAVTLNGPSAGLIVEPGATFTNSLAFGATGGVLGGNGVFGNSVTLGAATGVSPGHSVGKLTFNNGLTWNGGAFYDVEVQDASGAAGFGYDTIQVNGALAFNATVGSPFTLHLSSLTAEGASGNLVNFLATNSYSWQIVSTTGGIVGFNPAALLLDTTGFTNALGVGSFNVAVVGNNLLLNFTPVPEPSTWALMIAGLGVVGIAAWRRRR